MKYIRFVIAQKDSDSGSRQGLFQAMAELEDAGALSTHEQSVYDEIYEWFRENLYTPSKLARGSKPHAKKVALSWFRDSATEHIRKMYEVSEILRTHGVSVEVLRADRPGYVVYEDKHQIVAEPFNDTGA